MVAVVRCGNENGVRDLRKKIMILFAGVTIVLTVGVFGVLMFYKPKEPEKPKGVVFTEEKEEPVTGVNYPKEQLRQKMLDAYDYYDTVQGRFRTGQPYLSAGNVVCYGIDKMAGYGYTEREAGASEEKMQDAAKNSLRIVEGKLVTDYDYMSKTKEQYYSEADLLIYDIGAAWESVYPQRTVDNYLNASVDWQITKEEEVAGRTCYKIEGGVPLGSSSIESFHMWVDQETGCIIQLRAFDENGDIYEYLITDEIRFNEPVERVDPGWE